MVTAVPTGPDIGAREAREGDTSGSVPIMLSANGEEIEAAIAPRPEDGGREREDGDRRSRNEEVVAAELHACLISTEDIDEQRDASFFCWATWLMQ